MNAHRKIEININMSIHIDMFLYACEPTYICREREREREREEERERERCGSFKKLGGPNNKCIQALSEDVSPQAVEVAEASIPSDCALGIRWRVP